jgi:hypothetical protein
MLSYPIEIINHEIATINKTLYSLVIVCTHKSVNSSKIVQCNTNTAELGFFGHHLELLKSYNPTLPFHPPPTKSSAAVNEHLQTKTSGHYFVECV